MSTITKRFPFALCGIQLEAFVTDNHRVFICFNDLCRALGLNPDRQRKLLRQQGVYSDYLFFMNLDSPYKDSVRKRNKLCMDLHVFPYWVLYADTKSLKEEIRKPLLALQRDMIEVTGGLALADMMAPELKEKYPVASQRKYWS